MGRGGTGSVSWLAASLNYAQPLAHANLLLPGPSPPPPPSKRPFQQNRSSSVAGHPPSQLSQDHPSLLRVRT